MSKKVSLIKKSYKNALKLKKSDRMIEYYFGARIHKKMSKARIYKTNIMYNINLELE